MHLIIDTCLESASSLILDWHVSLAENINEIEMKFKFELRLKCISGAGAG